MYNYIFSLLIFVLQTIKESGEIEIGPRKFEILTGQHQPLRDD